MPFDRIGIGGKGNLLAIHRLRAAARRFDADVLHSHLSTASWWCGWLEQFGGPPSIGHVHGFTSALWHRRQSHLIACSAAVKQDLIDKGIRGGADHRDALSGRPRRHAAEPLTGRRARRVRRSGRYAGHRHVRTPVAQRRAIASWFRRPNLVLQLLPHAQFWCFGEGPLRPELEQTARELGIADRFKLLGFRRDVPDLMRAIDVMCLPSHREPFGLVYVEAALAEKPVIACDAGGAPEIIAHGETGLLVPPPPRNITPLADAIFTLLDNRDQAAAMGRRGRELALDRFGWPAYLAQLRELYDRVRGHERLSYSRAA